jgi:phenylacetic acid degradation operon negative regulatory protein
MAKGKRLDQLADELLTRCAPRAKSLIVSVFGDAIEPHGGVVWLGSLIALLARFGVNERLARTAVLRLGREHWLGARQLGRRSFYGFTASGRLRFEDAHRRIYSEKPAPWSGRWHLVFAGPDMLDRRERENLKRELGWLGFGTVAPSLLAHPSADPDALRHVLRDLDLADRVVVMSAESKAFTTAAALRELARGAWDLERLSQAYREFLESFRAIAKALAAGEVPGDAAAFRVRVLLIHEYRRILLRDPQLPEELLPRDWAGAAARLLARDVYRRTARPAERYLMADLETAEGPLPAAAPYFYARFGGLPMSAALSESAAE